MELLQTLGIDWKLLLAQVVNFTILLVVLFKVAYKPLQKLMTERAERIAKGLTDAEAMRTERQQWEEEHAQLMASARVDVEKLMVVAQDRSKSMMMESKQEAAKTIAQMVATAKTDIAQERAVAMKGVEQHAVQLVAEVAAKFLGEKLTKKEDEKLIERYLQKV